MTSTYLRVAGKTDVGKTRGHNEDAFVVADLTGGALIGEGAEGGRFDIGARGVLLAVSDGMGGARAGEVASALVIQTLTRALTKAKAETPSDERLHQAVQRAHSKVWKEGAEKGYRMGATLTAVYVEGEVAYIAEVGDSRAYLLRAGEIAQLTEDQSLVQQLLGKGVLSPEEAEQSELRNVILQAMGHQETVKVALGKLELRARDCLVLCSDGLTKYVSKDEIRATILAAKDLGAACDALVAMANDRGGEDNITVVLGGLGGELPAPSLRGEGIEQTFEVLQSFDGK